MKQKQAFQATSLRKLLVFLMILILAAAIGGFYLGLQQIRAYAVEVSHTTQDASASGAQVDRLRVLEQQLAQTQTLVEKADRIFTTDADYQSQAVKDLQKYASVAGVTISNTDFAQGGDIASQPYRLVTIRLEQPVSYERVVRFLQLVEGSIPKMQVDSITITRPASASGDQVNVESIGIRISVR